LYQKGAILIRQSLFIRMNSPPHEKRTTMLLPTTFDSL